MENNRQQFHEQKVPQLSEELGNFSSTLSKENLEKITDSFESDIFFYRIVTIDKGKIPEKIHFKHEKTGRAGYEKAMSLGRDLDICLYETGVTKQPVRLEEGKTRFLQKYTFHNDVAFVDINKLGEYFPKEAEKFNLVDVENYHEPSIAFASGLSVNPAFLEKYPGLTAVPIVHPSASGTKQSHDGICCQLPEVYYNKNMSVITSDGYVELPLDIYAGKCSIGDFTFTGYVQKDTDGILKNGQQANIDGSHAEGDQVP
ncbi:MAG TPA: hypothetical protein VK914_01545 [bacterium]|nr:hypothetical protein [bacterium]